MINKINTNLAFRNNSPGSTTEGIATSNQFSKKDWLQKHYDNQYIVNKKANNNILMINGLCAMASLITGFISEKYRKSSFFAAGAFALGTLVTYLFRPQKEKYDAQVQIELNKEATNAIDSSK